MSADRKEQILAAAYEIIGSEGIEGLHARSVAARIGINHAAVHYYYPKRGDLLAAVAVSLVDRFARDRAKLVGGSAGATVRIEGQLAQAEVYCKPNSRFLKNWASLFVAAASDQKVRELLECHLTEWAKELRTDIERGSHTGEVRRASPFANSELLVATLLGLMLMAHTFGEGFDVGERLDVIAGSLLV